MSFCVICVSKTCGACEKAVDVILFSALFLNNLISLTRGSIVKKAVDNTNGSNSLIQSEEK
ncbi:MAG: hypothetical protein LBV16_08620 [Elusimicrobiota bacterium]|nr:hypothetical protein [Elusimicrobiota bacterium]